VIDQAHQAHQEVRAAMAEGLTHCLNGRIHEGCLNPESPSGKRFTAAYETWMQLRAEKGNRFALSLGYGPKVCRAVAALETTDG